MANYYVNNKATLCWKCKHSVPKLKNDEYITGCSWSLKRIPVFGWKAKKRKLFSNGTNCISYCVEKCPEYVRG